MATVSPAAAQVAPARPDRAAEIRIERLFSVFVGAGYLCHLALLAGSIVSTAEHAAAWWTPTAILLAFGPPVVLAAVVLTRRRMAARGCAVGPDAAAARSGRRRHIEALLHDWVISTMLAAGRQGNTESVRRQAAITLGKLDSGPTAPARLPAATAMAHLRAGVLDVDRTAAISTRIDSGAPDIPTDVIDVTAAAAGEAVRNSILHAGPGSRTTVSLYITGDGVEATVTDDGTGFRPYDVPPHRLGLAVSVLGRMRALPGGSAEVITAPGEGTTVNLRWTRSTHSHPGARLADAVRTRGRPVRPDTAFLSSDVRDLLGMNTRTAHLVAIFFLIALPAELIVSVDNGSGLLSGLTSLLMIALCAAGLLTIPADPLPTWHVVAVAEHDRQMRALDHRVRPMLERITAETPLTEQERARCLALEAQLRDALRAPVLAGHERTAQAAARARERGVTVVMVDGHGLDDAPAAGRENVLERVAGALDTVATGSIVIRVLPPGRDLVATAVIDPDAGSGESVSRATRLEFSMP